MRNHSLDTVDVDAVRRQLLGRTEKWSLEQIHPSGQDEWRSLGDIRALRDSISTSGLMFQLICLPTGTIFDGYRRYRALGEIYTGERIPVIVVENVIEAVIALGIAADEQRVEHSFAEQLERISLASVLRTSPGGVGTRYDKGAVFGVALGVGVNIYYPLARLRKRANDTRLPAHIRELAESKLEDVCARGGAGVHMADHDVLEAMRGAGITPPAGEREEIEGVGEPKGSPPDLPGRVINTLMHAKAYADALADIPGDRLRQLPDHSRVEATGLLDCTMKSLRTFRKNFKGV